MRTLTKPQLKKVKKITKQKVWEVFSKYIRLKYADKNGYVICYTCGRKMRWQESDAGHGASGRGNAILFNEKFVRPQCIRCNIFLKGNYDVFHAKLIKEYGPGILDEINKLKKTIKKFTQSELKELYEHYKKEVEKLLEVKNENN
jgi:hypothetical protein